MINFFQNDLILTLEFIQQQVSRAAKDPKHELHHVSVATIGARYPEVRTVVLRAVDWASNSLFFHSDVRSQKYLDLTRNSQASILGYHRKKSTKLDFVAE